ncbi:MAG: GNAT family N-acetyltransferase [Patescibacteria group bacterium]
MLKNEVIAPDISKAESGNQPDGFDRDLIFSDVDKKFRQLGIISGEDGAERFDLDALGGFKMSDRFINKSINQNGGRHYLNYQDILDYLRDKKGLAKDASDDNGAAAQAGKPLLSLPNNIEDAKRGDFSKGIIKPWEIGQRPEFSSQLKLDDGNNISLAELYYLQKFKEIDLRRNEKGNLEYTDPKNGQTNDFAFKKSRELFNRRITFVADGKKYSFEGTPTIFIKKFLPTIDSLNLFKNEDLKTRPTDSESAAVSFSHDRKFGGSNPYVNISGENNKLVRYYIGRNKITGTDKEITPDIKAVELAKDLMGITETSHGREKILYTFNKLSEPEYKDFSFADKRDVFRTIPAEHMKERIKPYHVSDHFPKRPQESVEEYADRLSNLNDVNFVHNRFRSLFLETKTPIRELSWSEQILIANYTSEIKDEQKLKEFVGRYGIDGLKTFLAMERGNNLGEKIIELGLGNRIAPEKASAVFSAISKINELTTQKINDLIPLFFKSGTSVEDDTVNGLRQVLLQKSAKIIEELADNKNKNFDALLHNLNNNKSEITILAGLLESIKKYQKEFNIESARDLSLQVNDYGEGINEKDKKEVLEMAEANWNNFGNDKMAKVALSGLEEALENDKNQRAYILKFKDEAIGFVRFEKTDRSTVYAGSFNVSKDLRGLAIGNDLMEKALMREGDDNVLEATASIKIPAGCSYVEKIGFVANGIIENYHQTGESLYNIKLDKENNSNYTLRPEGKDGPLTISELKMAAQSCVELKDLIGRETFVLRFDLNSEMADYQKTLSELLPKVDDEGRELEAKKGKYTLTRYFYDKDEEPQGNIRYLAFEKNH